MAPHEEFLELCAVSLSGELTNEERKKLDEHLRGCGSCRQALEQFRASIKATIPAVAEHNQEAERIDGSFSIDEAETAFFERFDREGGFGGPKAEGGNTVATANSNNSSGEEMGAGWGQLWMPFVAILILCVTLGIASYRLGIRKGIETVSIPTENKADIGSLRERLSSTADERARLLAQIAKQDQTIAQMAKQIKEQAASGQKPMPLIDEGHQATQAVASDGRVEALQKELEAAEQARSEQATRAAQLETKLGDLSKQLQDGETTIAQQKRQLDEKEAALGQQGELLAHDRDIRDLMGARKLYVVDVYDVAGNGTSKPYGRVFYTQGKSLIFYAYDLDQEPGLRKASTFQAWGRRGANKDHALNLGVFYEDNTANKRWVVKFDDPKSLAQIDAVFVTVEPDGHSSTPRGKQVLFAYLRVDPNHP